MSNFDIGDKEIEEEIVIEPTWEPVPGPLEVPVEADDPVPA